ncbi:DnaJ domain-containing protein [Thioalkalicoccus limnaeus]|uniref:DnaJ domain-containing protein n=1 Tax=Thioalkalicoccus limnaeus TaxID=120681 RepID=A0ABV4BAL2_9GAMM
MLLLVALDYHRAPLRYPRLADARRPLPAAFEGLLAELGVALVPSNLAKAARRLRCEPHGLEEAVRFFVRHVLLVPDADHYRVLGLSHGAEPDAIRRHYYLLARLFHPDRAPPDPDRDAVEMARLNQAHWTLRDPERKRRYDADLAAQGRAGPGARPLPMAAFRPGPGLPAQLQGAAGAYGSNTRSAVLGILLLGTSVAIMAWLFWPSRESGIRMNPERAAQPVPGPAYLVGDRLRAVDLAAPSLDLDPTPMGDPVAADVPPGRDDGVVPRPPVVMVAETQPPPVPGPRLDQAAGPRAPADILAVMPARVAPSPPQAGEPPLQAVPLLRRDPVPEASAERPATAVSREPLQSMPESPKQAMPPVPRPEPRPPPQPAHRPVHEPGERGVMTDPAVARAADRDRVISRFVSTYRDGDLDGFVGLFVPHADVNEGRGHALIRSIYADFFRRVPDRRLEIGALRWHSIDAERAIGEGRVSVGSRTGGSGRWRHGQGGIRFDLVWDGDGYRIARMFYDVEPR